MDGPNKISPQLLAKAGASTVRLAPGDVVFRDGDAPDKMYVVVSGEVEIHLRDAVIETVQQGGTFGEMAPSMARREVPQLSQRLTRRWQPSTKGLSCCLWTTCHISHSL